LSTDEAIVGGHGENEKRNGGEYAEQWADWYAAYLLAEQNGDELPT
jgi:hypothetical protein